MLWQTESILPALYTSSDDSNLCKKCSLDSQKLVPSKNIQISDDESFLDSIFDLRWTYKILLPENHKTCNFNESNLLFIFLQDWRYSDNIQNIERLKFEGDWAEFRKKNFDCSASPNVFCLFPTLPLIISISGKSLTWFRKISFVKELPITDDKNFLEWIFDLYWAIKTLPTQNLSIWNFKAIDLLYIFYKDWRYALRLYKMSQN